MISWIVHDSYDDSKKCNSVSNLKLELQDWQHFFEGKKTVTASSYWSWLGNTLCFACPLDLPKLCRQEQLPSKAKRAVWLILQSKNDLKPSIIFRNSLLEWLPEAARLPAGAWTWTQNLNSASWVGLKNEFRVLIGIKFSLNFKALIMKLKQAIWSKLVFSMQQVTSIFRA